MSVFFNFGETVRDYDFKVINEREARASAGMMLVLGLLSLFSVYIFRTLLWAEFFSITFIIEFFVRTVINPKYAPYMLLSSIIVSNQKPEWVEAKPKQFAWILGMVLGAIMTYYLLFDTISLARLGICVLCLILLFVESAFGICLGCLLYKQLNRKLYLCPGGVCDSENKKKVSFKTWLFLLGFIIFFVGVYVTLIEIKYNEIQIVFVIEN